MPASVAPSPKSHAYVTIDPSGSREGGRVERRRHVDERAEWQDGEGGDRRARGIDEPVERRGSREPDRAVRPDLDGHDARGHLEDILLVDYGVVVRRLEVQPAQLARVPLAEEKVALPRREVRAAVRDRVRRRDGGRVPRDREDRVRAVLIRVVRRRGRGRACLVRAPSEVPSGDEKVHLVVALGPVLRDKGAARDRMEGEAEHVPVAVREDVRVRVRLPGERVAGRGRAVPVHPEDLPVQAEEVLRLRRVAVLSDDGVERLVRGEPDHAAVVDRTRPDVVQQDLKRIPDVAVRVDAHDPVVHGPVIVERVVCVHPRLGREIGIEREAEQPLLAVRRDVRKGVERRRQERAVLCDPDPAAEPLEEEDPAVGREPEGCREVQARKDGLKGPGRRGDPGGVDQQDREHEQARQPSRATTADDAAMASPFSRTGFV